VGLGDLKNLQRAHCEWFEQALVSGRCLREDPWLEALAVGSLDFVENVKGELRSRAIYRIVEHSDGAYALREQGEAYNGDFDGKSEPLSIENAVYWNENHGSGDTLPGPTPMKFLFKLATD
jgi:hypothetical protein